MYSLFTWRTEFYENFSQQIRRTVVLHQLPSDSTLHITRCQNAQYKFTGRNGIPTKCKNYPPHDIPKSTRAQSIAGDTKVPYR